MRSILVPVDRFDANDPRIQSALSIARVMDGHVRFLSNTPFTRFIAMDPFGGTFVATEAMEEADRQTERLHDRIQNAMANEDVAWDFIDSDVETVDALIGAARLSDLVIVARSTDDAGALAADVATRARTPVMAVPTGRSVDPLAPAMVAWNDSDEAAHALRAATPLLRHAAAVHLVTVGDEVPVPADALTYLSRHGVHAEFHAVSGDGGVETALLAAHERLGAGVMVMGAYGHSRLREALFGGVTHYFLTEASIPLLLVH